MAPAGQGQSWSDVLCCSKCNQGFNAKHAPVNLTCGHVVCVVCVAAMRHNFCDIDESEGLLPVNEYPVNTALLAVVTEENPTETFANWNGDGAPPRTVLVSIERSLLSLACFLKRVDSERGGSVLSEVLSRTMQRKLVSLLCLQLVEDEGRSRALKTCRAMADRVVTELLLSQQEPAHLSTQLWTAVRARGCQFLGPAMQEDVLKLVLLTLGQGAPIARKTLVMYAVSMLEPDYPQVSKTCVGHVVQLLYRASCFHVIKRDGESSLMLLKEEYRSMDSLRKEHDSQIVQMAMEAGLRISPDQWSALLYGDQQHRPHMQSIIDKLQSPQSYQQELDELSRLAKIAEPFGKSFDGMLPLLNLFADVHPTHHERVSWQRFNEYLSALKTLVTLHSSFMMKRPKQRQAAVGQGSGWRRPSENVANVTGVITDPAQRGYKTRMCRDWQATNRCPRGSTCTFAHTTEEMTDGVKRNLRMTQQERKMSIPPLHTVGQQMPQIHQQHHIHNQHIQQQHHHLHEQQNIQMSMQRMAPMGVQFVQTVQQHPHQHQQFVPHPQQVLSTGEMVPMVPMVMHSPPHPHGMTMQPGPHHVLVMPSSGVVLAPAPTVAQQIWPAPPPGPAVMMHPHPHQHNTPPQQAPPTYWVHQNTPPGTIFPVDASVPLDDGHWPREPINFSKSGGGVVGDINEAEQLLMKRKEILSRLVPLTVDEDDAEDGCVGHVSYTVASSVLDDIRSDRMEVLQHPLMLIGGAAPLELPPIPVSYSTVMPSAPTEENMIVMGDIVMKHRPRAPSLPLIQVHLTTVLTACPASLLSSESASTATVQADSTTMVLMDSIGQPLPTPVIQRTHVANGPDPRAKSSIGAPLPAALQLNSNPDPQDVVSSTLDRILDVKERLNEAEGAPMSCAVSQQLRVELRIAEREMDSLDPRTQASCLLKELQQVDREIERIEAARPVEHV